MDLGSAVVLVVDDQEANVALLKRVLARLGIGKVVALTDSRQTVAHYQLLEPDLILLDLHMPHMDGLAVLEALAEVVPADEFLPVVVLTADVTDEAKQAALVAGATDFLTKPFDHTEVILRVRNLLATRAAHLELRRHTATLEAQLAERADRERREADAAAARIRRVRTVLNTSAITMAFQPIVDLATGITVGFEALARFPGSPPRPPNEWFAEAAAAGLGQELELLAIRLALAQLDRIPSLAYLSLNVSPETVVRPELRELLTPHAERIVLELTEHVTFEPYEALLTALKDLRRRGIRIAVDDAGAGYASLRHILCIRPEIIKLDIALTRGICADPARRALTASLVNFGAETGAAIVAEGIETDADLGSLRRLGVRCGQGYQLARPGPLPEAVSIGARPTGPAVHAASA